MLAGEYSSEGAKEYRRMNSEIVHEDNFVKLFDGRDISKVVFSTNWSGLGAQGDFFQYLSLKHALMSGGVNHVETGCAERFQSSERVLGQVLQTLVEKYGYSRNQFFISSK